MSTTDFFIDSLTRRQIFLQRFSDGEFEQLNEYLGGLIARLTSRLENEPLTQYELARTTILLNDLRTITSSEIDKMLVQLELDLFELAQDEVDFTAQMMAQGVNVELVKPPVQLVESLFSTTATSIVQGARAVPVTLAQMYRKFSAKKALEVQQTVADGILMGRTHNQIVRELINLVSGRTKQQTGALVRTSVNHITSQARNATYKENSDIIDHERFVATLDSHTTITCMSLDGNKYPVGEGAIPPMHFGCRSVRVPIVKPIYTVKIKGRRASSQGPVDAKTTYQSWLKKQSSSFQDEVLGKERARLFRSGALTLDKFTDDSGVVYTLDQLKALNPLVFN